MKTLNTSNLPVIVALINKLMSAESILCFDSNTYGAIWRGAFRAGEIEVETHTHLQLLVISSATVKETLNAQNEINSLKYLDITVTILAHSKTEVMAALKKSNRFFHSVIHHADLLHSKISFQHLKNIIPADPQESGLHLIRTWNRRYASGYCFYLGAQNILSEKNAGEVVLYLVVQSLKQTCLGLIAVFLGYQPKSFDLHTLLTLCDCIDERLEGIIPRRTDEDKFFYAILLQNNKSFYRDEVKKIDPPVIYLFQNRCLHYLKTAELLCEERLKTIVRTMSN
ncbi:hypothetical protein [Pedobacter metabolipauper]|uniref:HEPN domain-containing protein n=1 Tax=Pedobacter metabolipauper TaxID=425513 RepID=A0A4R6SXQ2_9SPHI|nr:hypothetical protein [Pedobacter metabolipauper]TDQ09444.1 hypothetical protein ATK78_1598 [Pedobacter metabolipauper]